jgi:hypothetical protein
MLVGTGNLVSGTAGKYGDATHKCSARTKDMNFHQFLNSNSV